MADSGVVPAGGHVVEARYENWRGEVSTRRIRPSHLWFGSTEWHPERQWFLVGIDLEKGAERYFALEWFLDPRIELAPSGPEVEGVSDHDT